MIRSDGIVSKHICVVSACSGIGVDCRLAGVRMMFTLTYNIYSTAYSNTIVLFCAIIAQINTCARIWEGDGGGGSVGGREHMDAEICRAERHGDKLDVIDCVWCKCDGLYFVSMEERSTALVPEGRSNREK